MGRKFILLALAGVAATAIAMPTTAHALTLEDHDGRVAVGADFLLTSTDMKITNSPLDQIVCTHVEMGAVVGINNGARVTATGFGGDSVCHGTSALELTGPVLNHLETVGEDKGTMSLSFVVHVGPFECPYEGTSQPFTYQTGTGHDKLTASTEDPFNLSSPFEFCEPEEGQASLHGEFTLFTTDGDEVWFGAAV